MSWEKRLKQFCKKYDINIENIPEVINDPKVIPMIRGKAFEFIVSSKLSKILSSNYKISNPALNAQTNIHDVDVEVIQTTNNRTYRIECKLASKGTFAKSRRQPKLYDPSIKVKCMRSRTLGRSAAEQLSKTIDIPADVLMIHNDQYRPNNFDIVITSIANAFYDTNTDGLYFWNPDSDGKNFLINLGINNQHQAFNTLYAAISYDIRSNENTGVKCTRQQCDNSNCNFIPNYPLITFSSEVNSFNQKTINKPKSPWVSIEEIETLFLRLERLDYKTN